MMIILPFRWAWLYDDSPLSSKVSRGHRLEKEWAEDGIVKRGLLERLMK
jgi:hypothetical protein